MDERDFQKDIDAAERARAALPKEMRIKQEAEARFYALKAEEQLLNTKLNELNGKTKAPEAFKEAPNDDINKLLSHVTALDASVTNLRSIVGMRVCQLGDPAIRKYMKSELFTEGSPMVEVERALNLAITAQNRVPAAFAKVCNYVAGTLDDKVKELLNSWRIRSDLARGPKPHINAIQLIEGLTKAMKEGNPAEAMNDFIVNIRGKRFLSRENSAISQVGTFRIFVENIEKIHAALENLPKPVAEGIAKAKPESVRAEAAPAELPPDAYVLAAGDDFELVPRPGDEKKAAAPPKPAEDGASDVGEGEEMSSAAVTPSTRSARDEASDVGEEKEMSSAPPIPKGISKVMSGTMGFHRTPMPTRGPTPAADSAHLTSSKGSTNG